MDAALIKFMTQGQFPEDQAQAQKIRKHASRAQKKFLLVVVDYFSKWVEAEPLAKITQKEVLKFLWKNIACQFRIPRKLISDNRSKGKDMVEELPSILWAYRTTPRAPTQETPFNLVYGTEAILPVDIGQSSSRIESYLDGYDQSRAMELDLLEEKGEQAMIQMEAYQTRVIRSYNKSIQIRNFKVEVLFMKKVNPAGDVGKLEAQWEGPFKIIRKLVLELTT
ncbi:uncharacterized protein [Primulina eburnea]|uniref:uncharacterized protein n=1 Tax=Primulina eburnea TaxID=1245227 RepID=UPI003C6C6D15